mmetsp:Transcript_39015/g.130451  ORF Transcript_39015/g.130451 Transcript_39015/m.130451 type:complete len:201 (+) Transcript_39015:384-986(+)
MLEIFQKRSVSSEPAERAVPPSGLTARCSTRPRWPVSWATGSRLGRHSRTELEVEFMDEKPWLVTSSRRATDQRTPDTCEPVATLCSSRSAAAPVSQMRSEPSVVPPPVTRQCLRHGHQSSALTAAECAVSSSLAARGERTSQTRTVWSLLPEASCATPSGAKRRPHTSPRWAGSVQAAPPRRRTSKMATAPPTYPAASS